MCVVLHVQPDTLEIEAGRLSAASLGYVERGDWREVCQQYPEALGRLSEANLGCIDREDGRGLVNSTQSPWKSV